MTSENEFLEAILPEPRVLLHQRLEPYSVGHELILRRLRSPFLCEEPYDRATLQAKLFTAVYICCRDFDGALATLRAPERMESDFKRWRKLCGRFDPEPIVLAFLEYLKSGRAGPKFAQVAGRPGGAKPGAPFLLLLLQVLMGRLGFSRTEALNCPFGLARWHYLAFHEGRGGVQLYGTASFSDQELRAMRAEAEKLGWQPLRVERN